MTANTQSTDAANRRLRLGMVGGGPGAFIGAVHRIAARLDDRFELVAGRCLPIQSEAVPRLLNCISRRSELTEVLRRWRRRKRGGRTGLTPFRLSRPIIFISRPQKRFWRQAFMSSAISR